MSNPPVRLTSHEVTTILAAVTEVVPVDKLRAITLFGSRADLTQRGGDLDLWVICDGPLGNEEIARWARAIRIAIQDRLGEQKIDLVLSVPLSEERDVAKKAFLERISERKVTLWERKS